MTTISVTGLASLELIEDDKFTEYLERVFALEFTRYWEKEMMILDYEIINGEGSYEQFIFGGAPGL